MCARSVNRKLLCSALVLAAATTVAAQEAADLTPSGDPRPVPAVRLVEPRSTAAENVRRFFGRIAARETVPLSFEVGGRLVEFPVLEGARVEAGDVVARLDPDPFARAVERAELALTQAERERERARRLAESNVASAVRAEDAQTARDLADVALRDAREALADSVLTAPFDGIVAERVAETFSNVEPGRPILRLHDMSEVRVEIEIPERVLLRAGDPDAIAFTGLMPGDRRVPLRLVEFEVQTGRVGQSFRVALALPADAAEGMIPGATMTVLAALPALEASEVVPMGAILARSGDAFEVMVFRPSDDGRGTVERREVRVSAGRGTAFEVEGLAPAERIVAAGGHLLSDGQEVRVYDGLTVEER